MTKRGLFSAAAFFLLGAASFISVAFAVERASWAPRLTEVAKFPAEYQDAVRAMIAGVEKEKLKPDEYFAEIRPFRPDFDDGSGKAPMLLVTLVHQNHTADTDSAGKKCDRCRMIEYYLGTRTFTFVTRYKG